MLRHINRLWLALILLVWVNVTSAQQLAANPAVVAEGLSAAAAGRALFAEIDQRHNSHYGDFEVGLRMVLTTRKGRVTERQLRIRQLEVVDDGDQVLLVFDQPLADDELKSLWRTLMSKYDLSGVPERDAVPDRDTSPEHRSLASLCHVLLNSNEFLYVD